LDDELLLRARFAKISNQKRMNGRVYSLRY